MQVKLNTFEQMSFREGVGSPGRVFESFDVEHKATDMAEVRELRAKLKGKEELIGIEKETNNNLLVKLNSMNGAYRNEIQACKKDNLLLREELENKTCLLRQV